MPYDPLIVQPMREELTRHGFQELRTINDVDDAMQKKGTSLLVINSVCGCAAGSARPGVVKSLEHAVKPEFLFTVFAGQDLEATQKVREYLQQPPSSPSVAIMKDGQLVGFLPRHNIEGASPDMIAQALTRAYDQICVPAEA